ncbi:MAG: LAGLIDADG family homing endonuclease [Patescibacteria group bacterium]
MATITSLTYPKKSHRKLVVLPLPSQKFAEFIGIMLGDGGINNPWQATITVNAVSDRAYSQYIAALCLKLFDITPILRKRKERQALVISLASTTVVDFLVSRGCRRGNKLAQGLRIPRWIMANPKFRISCLRGLVDTDGCLFIHSHSVNKKSYGNIGLCFSSRSPALLKQVAVIFKGVGIKPHLDKRGQNIYLYRADAVKKYLKIVSTSNERISSIYQKWRGA